MECALQRQSNRLQRFANSLALQTCAAIVLAIVCSSTSCPSNANAQQGYFDGLGETTRPEQSNAPDTPQFEGAVPAVIADVRIVGNRRVPSDQVLARLRTRPNRRFDRDLIQADAAEIMRMKYFQNVKTYTRPTADGTVVTFEVLERPFITKIEILGNRYMTDRKLLKELDLKEGMPLDIYKVKLARQRLKNYYVEHGHPNADVTILEGDKLEDQNVKFLVHEDDPQKIRSINIEGNSIVSEARLKTFLKSKPSFLGIAGGKFNRQQIEQDEQLLTAYYHNLGFFNVRVGAEIVSDEDSSRKDVRFIIDEGERFNIRNVSFVGQQKHSADKLGTLMELESGQHFNATKMQVDENTLQDLYGSQGHIAAEIVGEVIYLEEGNQVDLVYRIDEGAQYRVGRINVDIDGDHAITRKQVILNRIGLKPGDVIDMRKIRASEVRLSRSQLFNAQGAPPPKLVVKPRDPMTSIAELDNQRKNARWQSPDDQMSDQSGNAETIWVDPGAFQSTRKRPTR